MAISKTAVNPSLGYQAIHSDLATPTTADFQDGYRWDRLVDIPFVPRNLAGQTPSYQGGSFVYQGYFDDRVLTVTPGSDSKEQPFLRVDVSSKTTAIVLHSAFIQSNGAVYGGDLAALHAILPPDIPEEEENAKADQTPLSESEDAASMNLLEEYLALLAQTNQLV
jgi:hypothetical protein